jgi:uncharacterized protein YceH (UPF0502 family)
MDAVITGIEARVLGSLMEKEVATPEYYPLSQNALVAACNQKTNREPVMSLDLDTVEAALESLREKGLVRDLSGPAMRVHKFSHRMGEAYNFDRREQAVLCVLMLRGPQTVGELRGRTERLYTFDDLDAVEATLGRLAERTPPLVKKLPRQAGEKEARFAHLLSGEVEASAPAEAGEVHGPPLEERVTRLEEEVAELRRQLEEFRRSFE